MEGQSILGSRIVNGTTVDLNRKFKLALGIMENTGKNLFITGRAGTGKSTLLECFRKDTKKNIAVIAPTGVAALNVQGQTIHSFFRFRPDITPDSVAQLQYIGQKAMYQRLDTIVIDEISMVRADLLDCIDVFMRLNGRNSELPFGGVQMIFIGDLYQLPPVVTQGEAEMFKEHYRSQYFFDSHVFNGFEIELIELEEHYRQTDKHFIALLNAIRNNSATEEHLAALNVRYDPSFIPKASDNYITLTTTNRLADAINAEELGKLPGRLHVFKASIDGFERDVLPADEELKVKEGMQVMLLNNDKEGRWVNGSIGVVSEVRQGYVVVRLIDGSEVEVQPYKWELFKFSYDQKLKRLVSKSVGSFAQYPMMPAWAVTIHKSQGKTFNRVIIDIGSGTFAHGQLYVALSRCTNLDGIVLRKKLEKRHMLVDPRVIGFLGRYQS